MRTYIFLPVALFMGGGLVFVGYQMAPRERTVTLKCLPTGEIAVAGTLSIEGMDSKAVNDAVFYLCDPESIGFGYRNARVWRADRRSLGSGK